MADSDNIKDNNNHKQAIERILDVAEELFSEKGFDGTSIRSLTAKAKCNLAAVNYYFGGKNKLYSEVFRRRMQKMRDIRIASINRVMSENKHETTLEELLTAFATAFIEPLVTQSSGRRFVKLMSREMIDSHLPAGMFFEETVKPVVGSLTGALTKVCPNLTEQKAVICIQLIIAQLVHVIRIKEVLGKVEGIDLLTYELADAVKHIVGFSAAGIRAAIEGKDQ